MSDEADKEKELQRAQHRRWYEEHRDEVIARSAKWVKDNPERHRARTERNREKHNEESRQYYYANKGLVLDYQVEWRRQNPEKKRAQAERYRVRNREKRRESGRRYYQEHGYEARARNMRLKLLTLEAYGNQCACCGEKEISFLTIDHVNDDGAAHRKEVGSGSRFYRWLFDHELPKDRFRILCYNCNIARARNGGICPHELDSKEERVVRSLAWRYDKSVIPVVVCEECGHEKEHCFEWNWQECPNGCDFEFGRYDVVPEDREKRIAFLLNEELR